MRLTQEKQLNWSGTACCVLLFLLALRIAHPVLEAPFSDDFSYIYTAKRAAETGRLIYNGWACPMLGIQVYLAALFIKVFGFSFTVVRASVMMLATLNVALLHRLFLLLSPRRWNAIVAAVSLGVAPVSFPHAVLFFTDLPGQFAFVVALFCCVKALLADDAVSTRRWLLVCVALNLVLGSVRQTAWLGSLVLLPMVGWRLRHRAGVLRTTAIAWGASCVIVAACLVWLAHAPYAPQEGLFLHLNRFWLKSVMTLPVFAMLEVAPLLLAMLGIRSIVRDRGMVLRALVVAVAAGAFFFTVGRSTSLFLAAVLIRYKFSFRLTLGATVASILVFLAALAIQAILHSVSDENGQEPLAVSLHDLTVVLLPYLLITAALVTTREAAWPRYILPLTPALAVLLYRLHAERTHFALFPVATPAAALLLAAFAVITTHDDMLILQPALKLQRAYLAMGLPRQQLEAGMSLDGWYELSTGHTINEPRIRVPQNAYHPRPLTEEQRRCHTYFLPFTPEIHPAYTIADGDTDCVETPPLASETQSFWLRPHQTLYLLRFVPAQQMP